MACKTGSRFSGVIAASMFFAAAASAGDGSVMLRETFAPGLMHRVSTHVELEGTLRMPAGTKERTAVPLAVDGHSSIEYDERILAAPHGLVEKTARLYRRVEFRRTVGGQRQESTLRPSVRRLVLLRPADGAVTFSPDGPLTWGEIDLVRSDGFTPALVGLCPDKVVSEGDSWPAAAPAVRELSGLVRLDDNRVACRFDQVVTIQGQRQARVALIGSASGMNEDGRNRQELDGYFYFDLSANHLSYLYLKGTSHLLDKNGTEVGKIQGRFVLTRQALERCDELRDATLENLEPTPANTLLLYDNPELGIRFRYARRWHVVPAPGRQIALEEPGGGGILITLDPPARAVTGEQFRDQVRRWLEEQKAVLHRLDLPHRLAAGAGNVEQFGADVELGGRRLALSYHALRQPAGGATLAARFAPESSAAFQAEIDRLAQSLEIISAIRNSPDSRP